jgi:hypothetical protein
MISATWVKYGNRHGWLCRGTVPARELVGSTFWVQAARVACIAEGGCIDMVQCYDSAIMTAGPLGANALSGTLSRLLFDIPRGVLGDHLGDLFTDRCLGLDSSTAQFTRGIRRATVPELREAFAGGVDTTEWSEADESAQIAKAWTEALAGLLADPITRRPVGSATATMLRSYATPTALKAFGANNQFAEPTTRLAKRGLACWLAFAINHPKGAASLLTMAGPDADRLLETASRPGPWPATFAQRVGRTRSALESEAW